MWVITLSNLDLCYASDIEQGIYYNSQRTYTFPITFPTKVLGASATGNLRCQLTETAINIMDMNVGYSHKQDGFVLSAGY